MVSKLLQLRISPLSMPIPSEAPHIALAHKHYGNATNEFLGATAVPPTSTVLPFSELTMLTMLALLPKSPYSSADLDSFINFLVFLRHSIALVKSNGYPGKEANAHEAAGLLSHLRCGGLPHTLAATEDIDCGLIAPLDRLSVSISS